MQEPKRYSQAGMDTARKGIYDQIEKCLRKGCVIRIQHTPSMAPRFTPWQEWCQSCFYDGDPQKVFNAIEQCRWAHYNHHIRLMMEDYSCHSSFTFVVHNPVAAVA
jgi:ribulose-bisphosphate carboxylase small chain